MTTLNYILGILCLGLAGGWFFLCILLCLNDGNIAWWFRVLGAVFSFCVAVACTYGGVDLLWVVK
jgi:hypothetical protein